MSSANPTALQPPPPNPLEEIPSHIRSLLSRLHNESQAQEARITADDYKEETIHTLMRDKFIALDEDKASFIYQTCRAISAKTIVEAGTSYGVSTIYLALAVAANVAASGGTGRVIGTEHEPEKAAKAREHWKECGDVVTSIVELREGDLRETLKQDLENVDFLLLDIWTPMALPTLKLVQPKMRYGAVLVADNTIKSAPSYQEFFEYIRKPGSGFINSTLPFSGGLEFSVYLPKKE